jgi:hypothetical protein
MPQQAAIQAIHHSARPPRPGGSVLAACHDDRLSVHALPAGPGR